MSLEFSSKTIYNMNTFSDEQCKYINAFLNKLSKAVPMSRDVVQPLIKDFKKTYGLTISWQVIDKFAFSQRRREMDPNMKQMKSARGGWVFTGPARPDTRTPEEKAAAEIDFQDTMKKMDKTIMNVTEMEDTHCLFVHEMLEAKQSETSIYAEFEKKFGLRLSTYDLLKSFTKSARRQKIAELSLMLKLLKEKGIAAGGDEEKKKKTAAKKDKDDEVEIEGPSAKKTRAEKSKTSKSKTDSEE